MSFFSSPPLRTRVAGSSDNFVRVVAPPGPDTAPNGEPIVAYKSRGVSDKGIYSFGAYGLDASGQWWMSFGGTPTRVIPDESGTSTLEIIFKAALYIAQALVVVLGTAVGGPAGFAAALALATWINLAKGASIGEAFAETLRQTPGIVDHATMQAAYDKISVQNLSNAAIAKLRSELSSDEDTRKAFDAGVALGKAKLTQDVLIAMVRSRLPDNHDTIISLPLGPVIDPRFYGFDTAIAKGAKIKDYVAASFGPAGTAKLESLAVQAAAKVEAASNGVGAAPSAGGGGGGGSSGGPGLGTAVALGAGGYALYKIWPKVMTHFSHPGQPSGRRR